jgi:hypothetical protein
MKSPAPPSFSSSSSSSSPLALSARWRPARALALAPLAAALIAACGSTPRDTTFTDGTDSGPGVVTPGDGGSLFGDAGGGPGTPVCAPNPAHAEIPGNNCDDDGDGQVDNPPTCDKGLAVDGDAAAFAKAIGICDTVSAKGFGLVAATYSRGYKRNDAPQGAQHGILPKYGSVLKPREGGSLGVISTGYAREYNGTNGTPTFLETEVDWYNWGPYDLHPTKASNGSAPPGFPKPAAGCPSKATQTNDVIDVKLVLKAPANAKGIAFDFNFFSSEWPAFVCSDFNDSFIAYLTAKGFNNGAPDNISFDAQKNPVSVNNGFFDRCTPNVDTGCAPDAVPRVSVCPGGPGELAGTGFAKEDTWCAPVKNKKSTAGGATGWLTSTAPVEPGEEFTLEFIIWDTGDGVLDSVTLLDNFRWVGGEVKTETARPR